MAQMTLDELSGKMKDIDFCMMFTKSRPVALPVGR